MVKAPQIVPYQRAMQAITMAEGSRDPGWGQSAGPPGQGAEPGLLHEPGGDTIRRLLHPEFGITEQLYRTLPEDSFFSPTVSPSKPIQFEMGAFTVPKGGSYWLFDYSFQIFRQSGIDPGDMVPAEDGRFSGVMGFDLNFSGRRMSNLLYQIDPIPLPVIASRPTFEQPTLTISSFSGAAPPAVFDRSAAQSFAANSNVGLSLLPVRREKQGPDNGVFTLIASEGTRVSLNVVIFKPIPSPITAIQGRHAGYLLHTQKSSELVQRLRPR